jgi:hypothetical protein
MIRINLLPEEFQARKRKLRISPHWGFVVAAVVGFFWRRKFARRGWRLNGKRPT